VARSAPVSDGAARARQPPWSSRISISVAMLRFHSLRAAFDMAASRVALLSLRSARCSDLSCNDGWSVASVARLSPRNDTPSLVYRSTVLTPLARPHQRRNRSC
jgi:hypothetical protein